MLEVAMRYLKSPKLADPALIKTGVGSAGVGNGYFASIGINIGILILTIKLSGCGSRSIRDEVSIESWKGAGGQRL